MRGAVKQLASPSYWKHYKSLPESLRDLADKNFTLLKENPEHPSLHYKKIGRFRSVRVGRSHRALAVETEEGILWFWIGRHDEYDRLIRG